jgi:hypothetical protein
MSLKTSVRCPAYRMILRNHVLVGTLYSDAKTVMELPQQLVLLISEPGMGKSIELSHLASVIKGVNPITCVVRINLNDHTDFLSKDEPSALAPPFAAARSSRLPRSEL